MYINFFTQTLFSSYLNRKLLKFPYKKKKLLLFFFFFLDLRILRWFQMCYHYELCHTTNRPNIIPHTYNIWTNRLEFIAAGGKLMLFRIWWWQSQFLWMVSACVWGIWICWGEFGGFAHCVYIQKKYIGGVDDCVKFLHRRRHVIYSRPCTWRVNFAFARLPKIF